MHFFIYNVEISDDSIKNSLETFVSKDDIGSLELIEKINIGNKYIVLLSHNGQLGCAEYAKGFNRKYKLASFTSTSNFFACMILKDGKGNNYLLMYGENTINISYSTINFNNQIYKLNLPESRYFISFTEANIENLRQDFNEVVFFDTTENVLRKYMIKVIL